MASCLTSIKYVELLDNHYEVLVVDNASTDGSVEMARERFPQVRLMANPRNVGFATANNQAIRQSMGRYVLLLNPDTEVRPGAVEALVDFMEKNPLAGAAGARLLNPDGSLQYSCSPRPTLWREFLRLFHLPGVRPDGYYEMGDWDLSSPHKVDVLLGACLMLRREALVQVGLLDEGFFMYSEEVDLCLRLQQAGWGLYWVPESQVVHYGGQSTRQAAAEMFLMLYGNKVRFFRKHYGPLKANIYKLVLATAALARLGGASLSSLIQTAAQKQNHTLASNYRRLLAALPGM